ncbi:MAG: tetratricopeptide repeat protein [Pirellulales bacterium]
MAKARSQSILIKLFVALLCAGPAAARGQAAKPGQARQLFLTGKYAEAREVYTAQKGSFDAELGIARCDIATGKYKEAIERLRKLVAKEKVSATAAGILADLALSRGDYDAAKKWADAALEIDENQTAARWVKAEMHRLSGHIDEAENAYKWFIDFYNATDELTDPDELQRIGAAAAQFARWNRVHDQFDFLVNELYPDILSQEKNYWRAHLEAGRLFLEKHNQAAAEKEFQAALKINPQAAEVHAAIAELALEKYELEKVRAAIGRAQKINPHLLAARQLEADVELANFQPAKAEKTLTAALKLNPVAETTLGRLAAVRGCVDGLDRPVPGSRIGALIDDVTGRNPHAGGFYEALADSLDALRRYPQAAYYYREAIRVMPKLTAAYGNLGMVQMRLGEEKEARAQLEKAFEVDFGNVRIKNSLEVLEVLDSYETLETEHFLVRFDPKHDKIQARYIASYLEEVYPAVCEQLGYYPKEKSLFEVFNKARNTGGHGWFSARMVGLPHIHTIGACAGKMVAMVSPSAMDQKFNWARVVKHEFVHVVNLQQTNFTIPHWFTEALAVYNEGYPRPQSWNQMLTRRVPVGKSFNLDTINLGFIRPSSSEDWQMAYCQAELYAQYMLEQFGEDALAKMLAGYADNLDTPAAIQRGFGVTTDEFEKGYTKFVEKVVGDLAPASEAVAEKSFVELEKAVEDDPENADSMAQLAMEYLRRKAYPKAGSLAGKALKINPKHQASIYVQVRLQMLIGDNDGVVEKLEKALDRDAPQENLLQLLAGLKYKAKQFSEAAELYELGRDKFSANDKWIKLLARVYIKSGESGKLTPILTSMAEADADDLTVRKKLSQIAVAAEDYAAAAKWSNQALQIDVLDFDTHLTLAQVAVEMKEYDQAIKEYDIAIELKPKQLGLRFALADACVEAGQKEKAIGALEELLQLDPDYPGADVLLESLKK